MLLDISMNKEDLLRLTRDLIKESGIKPRKRLGQHFTVDPRLVEEMREYVKSLGCSSDKPVVEVGTGFAIVTRYLANICSRIITIEIDRRIYNTAKKLLREIDNVELILGDALNMIEKLEFIGVVGTIPYSITGPLLGAIARSTARWAVLVLQKDVIDRITSPPGTRSYGSISVILNLIYEIEKGNVYPPQSFYPEPAVFSQTLILRRKNQIIVEREFEEFVKCIFSQRRRLAYKAIRKCAGVEVQRTDARIFQMGPEEIYEAYNRIKIGRQRQS